MAITVRNLEELSDKLSGDLEWRKKEIIDMRAIIDLSGTPNYLLRAGFVMLYAHFEGFIRFSSNAYVAYISGQKIRTSELKMCFSAMKLRVHSNDILQNNDPKTATIKGLIEKYHQILEEEFRFKLSEDSIPYIDEDDPVIKTNSNSSSVVLKEISDSLSLDYTELFSSRAQFIDKEILKPRNGIVHGNRMPISQDSHREVQIYVLQIMDEFSDAILSAAQASAYLA